MIASIAIKTAIIYFFVKNNVNYVSPMNDSLNESLENFNISSASNSDDISLVDIKLTMLNLDKEENKVNKGPKYEIYRFPSDGAFLYVFLNDFKCTQVKVSNETLWKYETNEDKREFPKSIYFRTAVKNATIYFNDNWSYTYVFKNNNWELASDRLHNLTISPVPSRLLVDLDIDSKASSDKIKYSISSTNKLTSYKTKGLYKFRSVKKNRDELWRSNLTKYAYQVNIYQTNNGKIAFIIYLLDGTRALYLKDEEYIRKLEEEESEPEAFLTKVHSKTEQKLDTHGFKVITSDNRDGGNCRENDVSKFTAMAITPKSLFLHFSERIRFIKLEHNSNTIWTHTCKDDEEYIQSIHYVPDDKKIVVWFNDKLPVICTLPVEDINQCISI